MAEVTMTVEEYLALLSIDNQPPKLQRQLRKAVKKPKQTGKKDPKMARALKKANAMSRTKSGKLRKGMTQAKLMKKAHQLKRKM